MKNFLKKTLALTGYSLKPRYKKYLWGEKTIVEREIYGYKAAMPKEHSIIFNLKHFPYYNNNLQRLAVLLAAKKDRFSIIDVGANIGDTALMFRQVIANPILCFEGDPFYFKLLQKNTAQISDCILFPLLLSDKVETKSIINNTSLGTTEVQTVNEGGTSTTFETLDNCLAEYLNSNAIGIFKTDTDGYDIKIIKGANNLIAKHQPVIFLEYDRTLFEKNGDDGLVFFECMKNAGYSGAIFYDNYGKLICTTNLTEAKTINSLHSYIKNSAGNFEFFDIMLFSAKDETLFQQFYESESAFFER